MATNLDPVFDAAGQYWGVDPNVLRAVSQTESSGDPTAVSKAGASGLMGIMPATAQAIGVDPKDTTQAIFGGARVLRENLDRFGNLNDALQAYNAGWDKAKWGNPETMAYVGKVASNYPQPAAPSAQDGSPQDPFAGAGGSDPAIQSAQTDTSTAQQGGGSDAFSSVFGSAHSDAYPRAANSNDPFSSVFGSAAAAPADTKAAPAQSLLARAGADINDAVNAAGAQIDKAGATVVNMIPGSSYLKGTALDPQRLLDADTQQAQQQSQDQDASITQPIGKVGGDILVGATLGKATGLAGNALAGALPGTAGRVAQAGTNLLSGTGGLPVQVLGGAAQGAGTAALTGTNPLAGAVGGAVGVPVGAVVGKAVNALGGAGAKAAGGVLNYLAPADAVTGSNAGSAVGSVGDSASASGASAAAGGTSDAASSAASTKVDPVKIGLFTSQADADKLAGRIYNEYQQGGPVALVQSKIPGVQLTAAQATGNPGLAQLERVRRTANPAPFVALDQQNAAARNTYAQQVIGTPQNLDAAQAARDAMDANTRPQVFASQQPVDTAPIKDEVRQAIAANNGRPTVQAPLQNVLEQISKVSDPETGQAMPADLWNVRKYLGDMVAPRAAGTANDGQAAAAQLMGLKPTIDAQIEDGAPGFQAYRNQFEQMSRPIDAMAYMQSRNLTNANGDVQLGRLDSFIKSIANEQNKPGYRAADAITEDQLQQLTDLRDDMRLAGQIDLGKARGSDTNVNLVTQGKVASMAQGTAPRIASAITAGGGGLAAGGYVPGFIAAQAGNALAGVASRKIANRLANTQAATLGAVDNRLLNPYR